MSIGTEIIHDALRKIGAFSEAAASQPENDIVGMRVLNSMLELWLSRNIRLKVTPLQVPGDELNEPADCRNGIISNLAIRLAPNFDNGKIVVSPQLTAEAADDFFTIKRLYGKLVIPNKVPSSTLIRGSGSRTAGFRRSTFFDGFALDSEKSSIDFLGSGSGGGSSGGILPIASGGTNASTAAAALANLGALPVAGGEMTGNLILSSTLTDKDGSVGTSGQVLSSTVTGTKWISAGGAGDALVANPLSQFAPTTSVQLLGVMTDETGTGSLVFATSPTLVTPALGIPSAVVLTNATGYPGDSSLVSTGTLISGSIGAAFGNINIGASTFTTTGAAAFGSLVLTGNLTVNGTITTINSTTLTVDDKNIELGSVDTPTDATADGGGITLKGATDKTFNWVNANNAWTSSQNLDLSSGFGFLINAVSVLNATTLGSTVVGSSLTSVGTLTALTVSGTITGPSGTWSATGLNLAASASLSFNSIPILSDAAGVTSLLNIDAVDSTTEATIEAAIDTLANLTSIQNLTVTLADAGADAFFGWDDSASAYENLTATEATAILNEATTALKGTVEFGTAAEYRSNSSNLRSLESNQVWDAMAEVALTSSSNSVAWDMSLGIDFDIDTLGESTTIANPTNTTVGKKGRIRIVQDGAGSRTVAFGTSYKFAGGIPPTASAAPGAEDLYYYDVISSTRIVISQLAAIA